MYRKKVNRLGLVIVNLLLILSIFALPVFAEPPARGMVNTVLGPMSAEKMGITLVHEHFAFAYPGSEADATMFPYDLSDVIAANVTVIKAAQKYGIKTIIDATPNDVAGRDPMLYKSLSKITGMNIICSTGLYTEHEGAGQYWRARSAAYGTDISKMISGMMIKEINEGIGTTGVKAGVIKCGTGPKMTKYEEAVLKAAAAAQKATGVPIITHTEGPTGGPEQADLFLKEGADPKKVMIGHVSNSKDINYHKAILAKGVYIAFDRFGLEYINTTPVLVDIIAQLCKEGYANQIMMSHDTVNVWLGRPWTDVPDAVIKMLANWRIDHISENVIPMLKAKGVTDEQIATMMVDNPRNLFLGKRK